MAHPNANDMNNVRNSVTGSTQSRESIDVYEDTKGDLEDLCKSIFKAPFETTYIEGGGNNRIAGIKLKQRRRNRKYILRQSRHPHVNRILYDVKMLKFLRINSKLPVPRVAYFDDDIENPISNAFMIMERIPGTNMIDGFPKIPTHRYAQLGRELACFYRRMLAVKSPICGIPICYRSDPKYVEGGNIGIMGFNRISPSSEIQSRSICLRGLRKGPYQHPAPRPQSPIEFFRHYFGRELLHHSRSTDWGRMVRKLRHISERMEVHGYFDNVENCLAHRDMAARNIMTSDDPTQGPILTGLIDWDNAHFVPMFAACEPPTWLWNGRTTSLPAITTDAERRDRDRIKTAFDAAMDASMNGLWSRYAYDEVYVLARRLVYFVAHGSRSILHSTEIDGPKAVINAWLRRVMARNLDMADYVAAEP